MIDELLLEDYGVMVGPNLADDKRGSWPEVAEWLYDYAKRLGREGETPSWLAPAAKKYLPGESARETLASVESTRFPKGLNLELKQNPNKPGEYLWYTVPPSPAPPGQRGRKSLHISPLPLVKFKSRGRAGVTYPFKDVCSMCGKQDVFVQRPGTRATCKYCKIGKVVDPNTGMPVPYASVAKNPEQYKELLASVSPTILNRIQALSGGPARREPGWERASKLKPVGIDPIAKASPRPELESKKRLNPEDISRMITEDIRINNGLVF